MVHSRLLDSNQKYHAQLSAYAVVEVKLLLFVNVYDSYIQEKKQRGPEVYCTAVCSVSRFRQKSTLARTSDQLLTPTIYPHYWDDKKSR